MINIKKSTFVRSNDAAGLLPIKTISSNYTIVSTDHTILVDSNLASIDVTLPSAADFERYIFNVKKISDSNIVSLEAESGEEIDGVETFSLLNNNESVTVQSDGVDWRVIAKYDEAAS